MGALYNAVKAQVIVTDPASAETIKYAANAFLATKLSFINAIAAICEGVGADVDDVVVGMGYDKRIGTEFLRPGPGWGGSCFPKDSRALLRIATDAGYRFDLLAGVIAVNDEQFDRVADKIRVAAGGDLKGSTIAVLGLTFKARTDDLPRFAVAGDHRSIARCRRHREGVRPHRRRSAPRPADRDCDLRRRRRRLPRSERSRCIDRVG